MNDRKLMLIAAFVSLLCVVWAITIPSYGMAVALFFNAVISFYLSFRMKD